MKTTFSDPATQMQRLEDLWACFLAVKTFFEKFFSLDAFSFKLYPEVSMAIYSQVAHCLVVLCRLSSFESADVPSWDRKKIRKELNLGAVVKMWGERWDSAPASAGLNTDMGDSKIENPWTFTSKKLKIVGKWWDAKLAAMEAAETESEKVVPESIHPAGFGIPIAQPMDGVEFAALDLEHFDDVWLRDMMAGGYDFGTDNEFVN